MIQVSIASGLPTSFHQPRFHMPGDDIDDDEATFVDKQLAESFGDGVRCPVGPTQGLQDGSFTCAGGKLRETHPCTPEKEIN